MFTDFIFTFISFIWYDVIVRIFVALQDFFANNFRPFPIVNSTRNTYEFIRNENLKELEPTIRGHDITNNSSKNIINDDKNRIKTINDAVEEAIKLKRFLVVFAHSEMNDRSVAALEGLTGRNNNNNKKKKSYYAPRKLIQENFVFFAYSVLDREMKFTPGFLTSCRSLPAVAVFHVCAVLVNPSSEQQYFTTTTTTTTTTTASSSGLTSPSRDQDGALSPEESMTAENVLTMEDSGNLTTTTTKTIISKSVGSNIPLIRMKEDAMSMTSRNNSSSSKDEMNISGSTQGAVESFGNQDDTTNDFTEVENNNNHDDDDEHDNMMLKSNRVELLATLEGAATSGTICLFLERCLATY